MNFCFIIDQLLSISSQPGINRRLQYYVNQYKENNVQVLVSLYKEIEKTNELSSFTLYHYPFMIQEATDEGLSYLDKIVSTVTYHMNKDETVNINCKSGISESSIILIAIMMKHGKMNYEEATTYISKYRYAESTEASTQLLKAYEKRYLLFNRR